MNGSVPPGRWGAVLDIVPMGVVIADASGRIEYRNPAARVFDGTHTAALIDAAIRNQHARLLAAGDPANATADIERVFDLDHGDAQKQVRTVGDAILESDWERDPEDPGLQIAAAFDAMETRASVEERVEFFGPPRLVVRIVSTLLGLGGGSDGGVGGVASLVIDVSESDRLDRIRSDFVANVSHELKTPLGALTLLIDTIAEADDQQTRDRLLDRMEVEASRANRTVARLVELSEIESGTPERFETLTVGDIIGDAVARVAERARHRGVTIDVSDRAGRFGVLVSGSKQQLESAVVNLVENAVLHSDAGATVEVGACHGDGARMVSIEVVDHGVGIPRIEHERVFERFYRVDRGRSNETGGTGLGLSIVRRTALAHGGDVELESVEGEGSRFRLRLPIVGGATRANEDA